MAEAADIRAPRVDELAALSALMLRSKAVWGYDADFMEACVAPLTLSERDIAEHSYAVIDADGVPVAVAGVSVAGDRAHLEHLFVDPSALRRGLGERLIAWARATAAGQGAREMDLYADPQAEAFYLRMGAVRDGEVPSDAIPGRMLPRLVFAL